MKTLSRFLPALILFLCTPFAFAQTPELTVAKIMQDPATWIGDTPSQPRWAEDGSAVYFSWNPGGAFMSDSLFKVTRDNPEPTQVTPAERRAPSPPPFSGWRHGEGLYDSDFARRLYTSDGDLFIYNRTSGDRARLTETVARESNPRFSNDGTAVLFLRDNNVFKMDLNKGRVRQLTNLRSGDAPKDEEEEEDFLITQQVTLFEFIEEQVEEREAREAARERDDAAQPSMPVYYYGKQQIRNINMSPSERFVAFTLSPAPQPPKSTLMQDYVTESGFASDRTTRPKVGTQPPFTNRLFIQDLEQDTTYEFALHDLPGSYDVPPYLVEEGVEVDSTKSKRNLFVANLMWSDTHDVAVVEVLANDHKDRWLAKLDPTETSLSLLDRQHDPAWIAGPGVGWFGGGGLRWMADGKTLAFQSEATGYSHLYTVDVTNGKKQQLTDGAFEVFNPQMSKDGKTWYFTSSEGSPHERHFYKMGAKGGKRTRLTSMVGNNNVALSPDESSWAMQYSYSNQPPEVYVAWNGEAERVTYSTSDEWNAYPWRDPEIIHIPASDDVQVPARIYEPESPNGAAVFFVHGAGYLQNVHKWWSNYDQEYMFHNLLADKGYLVLDLDYRASAGYGRDWRTAIYRYMGGRDLGDYVDASHFVESEYGIDPERVFIYGGSYGGFITLMALFNHPDRFGGGAALRSVTDWAHYNHGYTSNILNTPETDSLAFVRSSPIYFAEGLEDPLLIAHGMVDTNVHFQDVVRLAQRLIELGKEDWEMAVYPVENHGFTEPASWTDEYRRILKLIEESVGNR